MSTTSLLQCFSRLEATTAEAARFIWLQSICATDLGRQLVRSVLGVEAGDLAGLLQGRATLPASTWRRLMAAAEAKG